MIQARCNNKQEVVLTLAPTDADGQPVILDADAVKVTALEGNSTATVTRKDDGTFEVVLRSEDGTGFTLFRIDGDALPGEGVELISEEVNLQVVNVAAVALGLQVTAVRAKSPLPTPAPGN